MRCPRKASAACTDLCCLSCFQSHPLFDGKRNDHTHFCSGLVALDLITPTNGDHLSARKYKCNASFNLVKAVADTLRFDLNNYIVS